MTRKKFSAAEKKVMHTDERITKMLANREVGKSARSCGRGLLITPKDDEVWSIRCAACAYLGGKGEAGVAFGKAMKVNQKEKILQHNRDAIRQAQGGLPS